MGEAFRKARARLAANGVAYGGGFRDLAASQSNGVDAESDGLVTGEIGYDIRVRGVTGVEGPFTGVDGAAGLGELTWAAALFVCASRRRWDIVWML